jgi:hypothetical protein
MKPIVKESSMNLSPDSTAMRTMDNQSPDFSFT